MDWSIFPRWVWDLMRDPVTPVFLIVMTGVWLSGMSRTVRGIIRNARRLETLAKELSAQKRAAGSARRQWILNGAMRRAFSAAGLDTEGGALVATAVPLDSGDGAVKLDEVNRLLEPSRLANVTLPFGSRNTGSILVGLGAIGTFLGIVVGLSGMRSVFGNSNSAVFLAAIGDLLDGAALAFVTSLYGLAANLICGVVHRRSFRFLLGKSQRVYIAALEGLNPSTDNEFLRAQFFRVRRALEDVARTMGTEANPICGKLDRVVAEHKAETNKLIKAIEAAGKAGAATNWPPHSQAS